MRDLEFIRGSPAVSGDLRGSPAQSPNRVSESAAQTLPSTRAGGQDDGSYTNSLKPALSFADLPSRLLESISRQMGCAHGRTHAPLTPYY